MEVGVSEEGLKCWIFENGLLRDVKGAQTMQEMLRMDQPYIILKENMNTQFDNPPPPIPNLVTR